MDLKEEIRKVLSEKENKKEGLHVSEIADRIIAANSITGPDKDQLQSKINGVLLADVNKKSGNNFAKVKNIKTNKFKKGFYKMKPVKGDKQIPQPTPPENPTPPKPKPDPILPDQNTSFIGKAGECAVIVIFGQIDHPVPI